MYTVTMINRDGTDGTYTLNEINVNSEMRLSDATIEQSINEIHSFSFTINSSHPYYAKLRERLSQILVKNSQGKCEFSGYVLKIREIMNGDGKLYKNVVCESALGYLYDSIQPYWESPEGVAFNFEDFVRRFLDVHNSQVEDYKKIYPGTIFNATAGNVRFKTGYGKSFEVLKYMTDSFSGEFRVYVGPDDKLYFDFNTSGFINAVIDTPMRLAHNLKNLEVFNDSSEIITRLYVYGTLTGDDQVTRVDISLVNGGLPYIEDTVAKTLYGTISDVLIIGNEARPDVLLTAGERHLEKRCTVTRSIANAVLDLSVIEMDSRGFELYERYQLIHEIMGIDKEIVRIIKKTFDINAPYIASIEIGRKFKTATQMVADAARR